MYEHHITSDNRTMLIAQINDRHLLNTIKLVLNRIIEVKESAKSQQTLSEYDAVLYSVATPPDNITWSVYVARKAARANKQALQSLYPYLAEALLRGKNLEEIRDLLVKATGREGVIRLGSTPALVGGQVVDVDPYIIETFWEFLDIVSSCRGTKGFSLL